MSTNLHPEVRCEMSDIACAFMCFPAQVKKAQTQHNLVTTMTAAMKATSKSGPALAR